LIFAPTGSEASSAVTLSGIRFGFILVILAGLRLYRGETQYMQDERTRRIGACGLPWSWFLTFIVLFGFFRLDTPGIWSPDGGHIICPAHPHDGDLGQCIPGVALQERGCGMNGFGGGR
jgi:hypothetical protein